MKGSSSSDDFRFLSWHLVDTFVYFSHQLLTIPPIPWIFSAHRNGVEILGSLIFRFSKGSTSLVSLMKIQSSSRSDSNFNLFLYNPTWFNEDSNEDSKFD